MTRIDPPLPAVLALDGWEGRTLTHVLVVGEEPKRYVIRAPGPDAVKLAGRGRWLDAGNQTRVPKSAVRFEEPVRVEIRAVKNKGRRP